MAKAKKAPEPIDPLNEFAGAAGGFTERAMMMVLWKGRHANPQFTFEITPKDLKGFKDCVEYLEVTPTIRVYRPQGLPAQDAVPAHGNRRAVPARPAQPPKDYVVVQMVGQDGNGFVPCENNEEDNKLRIDAENARRLKETAPQIAAQLQNDLQTNTISTATIQEAIAALRALAR